MPGESGAALGQARDPAREPPNAFMRLVHSPARISAAIALLAVLYGIAGLRTHGSTIDSPSLFYAGDQTLFWLTHRGIGALNFQGPPPVGFQTHYELHPMFEDPQHYPVFPGLVGSVTSAIVHDALGVMGVIDGHHLGLVLLNGFTLFVQCLLLIRLVGTRAAVAATIALAFFPSAVGHAFNNAKDWPCAQFYSCALLAAAVGLLEARAKWLLLAGVFWGLALSSKLNGAFVFFTLLLWVPFVYFVIYHRRREISAGLVAALHAAPYIAVAVFVVLWPWLYYGPVSAWWAHLQEYLRFMLAFGESSRPGWTNYPFRAILFMTPPLVLACAAVYTAAGWRGGRERLAFWALCLCWMLVPVVRIALPGSNFYDANRHFIEYVPALCVMAGCGFDMLCTRLWPWFSRLRWVAGSLSRERLLRFGVYAASVAAIAWPLVKYAPYETTYFNVFIGGLRGAQERHLFSLAGINPLVEGTEGDYWYNSLRQGLRDIRAEMRGGEVIGLCAPHLPMGRVNWEPSPKPEFTRFGDSDFDRAHFVYAMPRGGYCDWEDIDLLTRQRPVLKRVERGGGLIYLVLGPRR
jgi:hypothetical protein